MQTRCRKEAAGAADFYDRMIFLLMRAKLLQKNGAIRCAQACAKAKRHLRFSCVRIGPTLNPPTLSCDPKNPRVQLEFSPFAQTESEHFSAFFSRICVDLFARFPAHFSASSTDQSSLSCGPRQRGRKRTSLCTCPKCPRRAERPFYVLGDARSCCMLRRASRQSVSRIKIFYNSYNG